jgi:hypothetical protein
VLVYPRQAGRQAGCGGEGDGYGECAVLSGERVVEDDALQRGWGGKARNRNLEVAKLRLPRRIVWLQLRSRGVTVRQTNARDRLLGDCDWDYCSSVGERRVLCCTECSATPSGFFTSNDGYAAQTEQSKAGPITSWAKRKLTCFRSMITELWRQGHARTSHSLAAELSA